MYKIYSAFKSNYLIITAFASLVLGLSLALFSSTSLHAETKHAGVLSINYAGSGPLFSANNISPGFSENKSLTVTNNGAKPHSFSIAVKGSLGELADVIYLEPRVLGSAVWKRSIKEIANYPESNIIVGSIAPGGSVLVDIEASMPESVGNEYQGTSTLAFDFVMGNESTDEKEDTDGGETGIIDNEAANTVAGVFQRQEAPVADGDEAEAIDQQSQNMEQGEVAGVKSEGEAQGAKNNTKSVCFWWWLLSIVLAMFLVLWAYINKKSAIIFGWFWPVFAAVILYFLHWGLHDFYQPSKYCDYFILIEVALLALYYIITSYIKEESEEKE
ncbi:MAG: hypothetical protein BWY19_00330 [bacterium ADurb.Bin212]|nr:MAG: hypothetical protein BWY19_00330 [bacterium ADurb.Bin212]